MNKTNLLKNNLTAAFNGASTRMPNLVQNIAVKTGEGKPILSTLHVADMLHTVGFTPQAATRYTALLTAISQGETSSQDLFNTVARQGKKGISHWGSLQWSKSMWDMTKSKGALILLQNSDPRLKKILTSMGWSGNNLLDGGSTSLKTSVSKDHVPAALLGSAQYLDEVLKKEFYWNGKQWTPRWKTIASSPRWQEITKDYSHLLKNKEAGFAALASLVWINGASWFKTGKLKHLYRLPQTADNYILNLKSAVGVTKGEPIEPIDTSSVIVTSDYHVKRGKGPHEGIDYKAAVGTPLWAHFAGKVTGHSQHKEGGNQMTIIFDKAPNWKFTFAHLKDGTRRAVGHFNPGDKLGETGISGTPRGPHLHVSSRKDGARSNPSLAPVDIKTVLVPFKNDSNET